MTDEEKQPPSPSPPPANAIIVIQTEQGFQIIEHPDGRITITNPDGVEKEVDQSSPFKHN